MTYMTLLIWRQVNHRILSHQSSTGAFSEGRQDFRYCWDMAGWFCNTAHNDVLKSTCSATN